MKISLIVTDGLRQIALTPQDKEEIRLLECLTDKEWQLSIKRGQFFICQGGYARFGHPLSGAPAMMTTEQAAMARHALGLPNESNQSYRNRYFTSCGSTIEQKWDDLVKSGWAQREKGGGKLAHFYLTDAGARLVLAPGETLDPEDFPRLISARRSARRCGMTLQFTRCFAMPNAETFSVKPIGEFVHRYLVRSLVSIDPFARNRTWFTHTNDLNPKTSAQHHMDAEAFLQKMRIDGVSADLGIFDPPYSPRQISECYKSIGLKVGMEETQNGRLYKRVRDALDEVMKPGGVVLSFGWQSSGMGIGRGYEPVEIALIQHGGGHNDTICIAERKMERLL